MKHRYICFTQRSSQGDAAMIGFYYGNVLNEKSNRFIWDHASWISFEKMSDQKWKLRCNEIRWGGKSILD